MTLLLPLKVSLLLVTLFVLLSVSAGSQSLSAKSPFGPRWVTYAPNPSPIIGSSSLPIGAYTDGRSVYGFSLDDGSTLWQVNRTIEFNNQTYFPSLGPYYIIEDNPPQVFVDYALQVQIGFDLYEWSGFYLWDLKTGKFLLDVGLDPLNDSDAVVMATPGDVYVVQYGMPADTLYLLKGPDYSLKTPAASYSWPSNRVYSSAPPLTFLQSTQKLFEFSAFTNYNASLSRLDTSKAKQTGKINLMWQTDVGFSAPGLFPSQDESKFYGSSSVDYNAPIGPTTIFRLDLETGEFDWKRNITWPLPSDATYLALGLFIEVVDPSTNAKLPCGSAAVYLPNQVRNGFAFCIDPSSGNYVFNVTLPTNGLVLGVFKQWLMVYDRVSTIVGYNPFNQVAEGEEPQPEWKMSVPGLSGLTYPVGKDPKFVIVSSQTGLARWNIIQS